MAGALGGSRTGSEATPQVEKSMGYQKSQVDTKGAGLCKTEANKHFCLLGIISVNGCGVKHSGQSPLPRLSSWFLEHQPLLVSLLPLRLLRLRLPCPFLSSSLLHTRVSSIWPVLYSSHPLSLDCPVPTHGFKHHLYAKTSKFQSQT